jgi:hypothetical protein
MLFSRKEEYFLRDVDEWEDNIRMDVNRKCLRWSELVSHDTVHGRVTGEQIHIEISDSSPL